jgi:ubiquinone/menaquinone biosynthesis C-methylase UbiE
MQNKDHWNKIAKDHKNRETVTLNDHNQRLIELDFILTHIPAYITPIKILEVGCGNGYSTQFFTTSFAHVTAIDQSPEMIARAKNENKSLKTADFVEMDVRDIKYPDNTFDIAISQRCLINLPSWKDQQRAISELHRVLKPSGVFILVEGSETGLNNLNTMRKALGINEITVSSYNVNLKNAELLLYMETLFNVICTNTFGMYDFITRVVHPLYVHPKEPKYNAKLNKIAKDISLQFPNNTDMAHISRLIGVVATKW